MITFFRDKRGNQVEFFPCALKKYKQILAAHNSENLSLHEVLQRCGEAELTGMQLIHTFERCKAIKDRRENPAAAAAKEVPTAADDAAAAEKRYDLKRQRLMRKNFFESVDRAARPTTRKPQRRDSAAAAATILAGKLALNAADISI